MSERTSYEPGTPSWVDLSTPDPAAAKRFYGELFGWEARGRRAARGDRRLRDVHSCAASRSRASRR